jgi:hypothetical protein
MSPWVDFESLLALNGAVNLLRRDDPLFDQPMRDHRRPCSMEKVQNSMVNALKADPKFINPIAQKIGLGPPQFVAHLTQSLQSQKALILDFCRQPAEPPQEWARSVLFLVKDNFRSGHSSLVYSQICEIANIEPMHGDSD